MSRALRAVARLTATGAIAMALLVLALPAFAQDTLRVSLDEAVARALANSEEARIADAQVQWAGGRVKEALSEALPHVSYSFGYTRKLDSFYEDFAGDSGLADLFGNTTFGAANTWSGRLTASQVLWSSGKVGAGLAAARAARTSAESNRTERQADIELYVRRAYLDAVLAVEVARIASANREQAEKQAYEVAMWQSEGKRSEYDLLRARVDAANTEPVAVGAANDREIALLELKRLLNVPYGQPVALTTPLSFEGDMVPVMAAAAYDASDRAAIAAAEADEEAYRQLMKIERGRRWPDVVASTSLVHEAYPSDGVPGSSEFLRDWNASVEVRFPIFLGGRTAGAIQRAQADYEQARARADQVRESAELEVEKRVGEVERTMALLSARREAVHWAQRAYELAGVRFDNGLATQLEVSDARVENARAEVNEVQAIRDYLVALAMLEHALGHPVPTVPRSLDQLSLVSRDERNTR
jgi:outer membrane protein TolC